MGAIVKAPPDPIEQEIEKVQAAIIQVQDSEDPVYIAAPWKRRDLIEQLTERIATLRQVQAEKDQAAAEREHRQRLQQAWDRLAPKRHQLAERWNRIRDEARAVLDEAQKLDKEHISKTDRRGLSENIAPMTFLNARMEATETGPVILRPDHF